MKQNLSPAAIVIAIVVVLAVVGLVGWKVVSGGSGGAVEVPDGPQEASPAEMDQVPGTGGGPNEGNPTVPTP